MMRLPYHSRVDHTFVDGMHTIKDVVCNIMDAVLGKKSFHVTELELSKTNLEAADKRFMKLVIPKWLDITKQRQMISHPKNMKSHDWKQVCKYK